MSAQVLSFSNKQHSRKLHRYLVLKADIPKDSDLRFSISPEVMHWEKDIWIIDLGRTRRYWLAASYMKECDAAEIIQVEWKKHHIPYQKAISCEHPWQGLCLLDSLPISLKIFDFNQNFCQNLLKTLSWTDWLSPADCLIQKLEDNLKNSRIQRFRSKQSQLLRAMERLGMECPYDIKEADSSSMQKRFGFWVSKLWEWTFPESKTGLPLFQTFHDLNEFVWLAQTPVNPPKVFRYLEYSIEAWDHIAPFLQEDFELINKKFFQQKQLSACSFTWTLELYNGEQIEVVIPFRNPYAIYSDAPLFETGLTQARHQFEAWQTKVQEEKAYSDYPEAFKIVAWSLACEKSIFCNAWEQKLSTGSEQVDYLKIIELENKLPKSIDQYQSEKSFLLKSYRPKDLETPYLETSSLWTAAGNMRPLYRYHKAIPHKSLPYKSYFLEKNTRNWWEDSHPMSYNQDFYKVYSEKNWRWFLKTSKGDFLEIGSFD